MQTITPFHIIGLSVTTTNENGQSYEDMGTLWGDFFEIASKIPNRLTEDIYSIYTDYETDYRGKHTAILGYQVSALDNVPAGLVGRTFQGGQYQKITAKGTMPEAVVQAWLSIWDQDETLNRAYTADFEVHGERSQRGEDSEVDIYLAINAIPK